MARRVPPSVPSDRPPAAPLWLLGCLGALLLVLAGCKNFVQPRGQAADEPERDRYEVPTVGERTTVANAEPIALGGVGLVEGLEGTGGDCPAEGYRSMLANELRRDRVENITELLRSPDCAVVVVEASVQPGACKGDRIDVEVKLPPGSKATSLRGGRLRRCHLFNYDFARNLRPDYKGASDMLLGHKVATAEGPIITSLGDGDDAARARQGRIWSGAKLLRDNPLALAMNPDSQRAALTSLIADRVNATFGGNFRDPTQPKVAHTADKLSVSIRIPPQYRLNMPHYLRVVRFIPLGDAPPGRDGRPPYARMLADDLLDPARTVAAALRLEALGDKGVPALEQGLKSPHALVRFCSSEALAYLGSPRCGEALAEAARSPLFRAYALAALASLDESVCHEKLRELASGAGPDDLRFGAFRALRALDEADPLAAGEMLGDAFWLHKVASSGPPMVHLSTTKRAEVVLFGDAPRLKAPFSLLAGEFTVTATPDDARCNVSRVPLRGEPTRRQCSFELGDVLRAMASLGAGYPEVIALLQQASAADCVGCPVRVDALPQATDVNELSRLGREVAAEKAAGKAAAGKAAGKNPDAALARGRDD